MHTAFNRLVVESNQKVFCFFKSKFDALRSEYFKTVFIFIFCLSTSVLLPSIFFPDLAAAKDPAPLSIAISSEPASLNPHKKRVVSDQMLATQMFDELITSDNNWKIIPSLVEGWSNPDELTWIFKLRRNVRFHNGDLLTSRDVIFSIDRIRSKYKEYAGSFTTVDSYEIIDDYTFKIKTIKPDGLLLTKLTWIFIVPEKYIKTAGETEFEKNPIGSGPYKFVSGNTKKLQLKLNDNYWKTPAGIKDVIIQYVPQADQYQALLNGSVDIVSGISSDEFEKLKSNPEFHAVYVESSMFYYLGMDVKREKTPKVELDQNPFCNQKVRLAVAKAIDLDEINKAVFNSLAVPASQIANNLVFGFNPEIKIEERNIEKAKSLMKEAGYESGFKVVLNTPLGSREKIAHMLARQLSNINIQVQVQPVETKLFWNSIFKEDHEFSFFLAGWGVDRSMDRTLGQLFASRTGETQGKINFTMYSNPRVDELINLANGEKNEDKQQKYFQEAVAVIMSDKPVIPLFSIPAFYGLSKRVEWNPPIDPVIQIKYIKFMENKNSLLDSLKGIFK
ncbi:Glutathione-binding protein [Desulfonema limicola]|uniref:Glutathione-binding protein n=1 Tax=Desulfonema limicola TaxID=45656 RepID=A0A975GFR4_9BACT|nr:ABC transporter substrate-binding protein [Desulfonema limicola]QTA79440.1 Glutathione-binding protein [Desulfonema limicola]